MAQLYRQKVYYPFVKKIRKDKYNFDGNNKDIPEGLRAVNWMDGCASQLRLITSENSMNVEQKLKITCNKHSASRTAVEQAADTGAMFKELKRVNNDTEMPHTSNNALYHYLEQTLMSMETPTGASPSVLKLQSHKKKAILITAAKLPIAAACAYSDKIIKKAFVLNGQLDMSHKLVPCLTNLLNTYRGDIKHTCLSNGEELISNLYEEAYTQGMVKETTFDSMNIPMDKKTSGDVVDRNVGIQLENRQRSKILSSTIQIQERKMHLHGIRMAEHAKTLKRFEAEDNVYKQNEICEVKIASYYCTEAATQDHHQTTNITGSIEPRTQNHVTAPFCEVADSITYETISEYKAKMTKMEMTCFVQARSETKMRGAKVSYLDVPKNRNDVFERLWELHNAATKPRKYPTCPLQPQIN